MVHGYEATNTPVYFTVEGATLYRTENDLSGIDWIVARDMGAQRVISEIDPNLIAVWESANAWSDIRVIRNGVARKFQVLSMVRGDRAVSDNGGPAWNSGAYLDSENTPIYNYETNTVNEMLVLGRADTTVLNTTNMNLPYGTIWALNDPVVIEYNHSDVVYRRAIKNRIDETTLF